jgi:hypothetical protein
MNELALALTLTTQLSYFLVGLVVVGLGLLVVSEIRS